MLKGYDIILLSETWASDHDDFMLEGFEYHNYQMKCIHLNGARNSGGLGVFIRQSIREGKGGFRGGRTGRAPPLKNFK